MSSVMVCHCKCLECNRDVVRECVFEHECLCVGGRI